MAKKKLKSSLPTDRHCGECCHFEINVLNLNWNREPFTGLCEQSKLMVLKSQKQCTNFQKM